MNKIPMRHVHRLNGYNFELVHEKNAIPMIRKIVRYTNPDIIVEFGTGHGGLTYIFNDASPRSMIHTFNLNQKKVKHRSVYNGNVFFYSEDILKEPNQKVIDILKQDGVKFLYCDNGNKIQEVKYYSKYLNIGDVMGVHDWGEEITYEDIKDELIGFHPIKHESFEKNGWSSRFWIKDM